MSADHRKDGNAAPEIRAALDALRHIVQALRTTRDRRSRLSGAQLFALQQIAEHHHASVNDIAALTFTHQSSVSVVIQRLARQRLVAKVASTDDRRRQRLAITPLGRRALARTTVTAQQRLAAAIAALPADDRRTLARLLSTIALAVAPASGDRPPMFFEEKSRRGSAGRNPVRQTN